ncbi:MAG: hypothetical protein HY077_10475 [Elusimicrobia bacterium]|nr:hypothetical protein [Elusimicrobiota bacterium]
MRALIWLAVLVWPCALKAEDAKLNTHVQKTYIDPVLQQISDAARTGAEPNAAQEPLFFLPDLELSPHTRRAVDFVRERVVDPFTGRAAAAAGGAARALASPDAAVAAPDIALPAMDDSPRTKAALDFAQEKLFDPLAEGLTNHAGRTAQALGSANPNADAAELENGIFAFPDRMAARVTDLIEESFSGRRARPAPAAPLPGQRGTTAVPADFIYRKDSTGYVKRPEGFADAPAEAAAKNAPREAAAAPQREAAPSGQRPRPRPAIGKKNSLHPFQSDRLEGFSK